MLSHNTMCLSFVRGCGMESCLTTHMHLKFMLEIEVALKNPWRYYLLTEMNTLHSHEVGGVVDLVTFTRYALIRFGEELRAGAEIILETQDKVVYGEKWLNSINYDNCSHLKEWWQVGQNRKTHVYSFSLLNKQDGGFQKSEKMCVISKL